MKGKKAYAKVESKVQQGDQLGMRIDYNIIIIGPPNSLNE